MPRLKGRKIGISQASAQRKRKARAARHDHDARLRGASALVALAAESSNDSASTATTGDSVTPTDTPVSDSSTAQLPQLPPGARRAKRARAAGAQIADVDVPRHNGPPLAAPREQRARARAIDTASQHPLSPTTADAHPAAAAGATTIATSQACPTVTLYI